MKITEEIELPNDEVLEVEFTADCHWENDGIGSYEYWGQKCFDKGVDYVQLDGDIEWDKTKFTEEQNAIIESQPQKFWDELDERFCLQFSEIEPDYPTEYDTKEEQRDRQDEYRKLK